MALPLVIHPSTHPSLHLSPYLLPKEYMKVIDGALVATLLPVQTSASQHVGSTDQGHFISCLSSDAVTLFC